MNFDKGKSVQIDIHSLPCFTHCQPACLQLKALTWSPSRHKTLLKPISLTVQSGELVAVVGLNSAGKTSLLRCLYRVNKPSSGEVLLDGENIWSLTARHCAQRIAEVIEDSSAEFALTVFEIVEMGLIPKSTHWKRTSSDIIAIDNHSSGYWKINIT